jgi:PIN domain nuclease of toxin-antitoxin system
MDTHIWLWLYREPERIGAHLMRELRRGEHELWLSPVSIWEALLLFSKNKITVQGDPNTWVYQAAGRFLEAPLTTEIVIASFTLALHPDPADRFLAATAKVLGLTLVTADHRLLGLGNIGTLANR